MNYSHSQSRLEINLRDLNDNFLNIRKKIGARKIMAVVKADAYGHGMKECVRSLNSLENGPEYYAVATVDEAIELKKHIGKQQILLLEPINQKNCSILKNNIIPTVFNLGHVEYLKKLNKKIKIHIKIDTGMKDFGIDYREAVDFFKIISSKPWIQIDGVYSHFATSDEKDKTFAIKQLGRFKKIIKTLKKIGINYGLAHMANSGAILNLKDSYFNMVRPGLIIYGYYPSDYVLKSIKIKPTMSLHSEVSEIKKIKKNESVSYGRRFIANDSSKIAVIPVGYADGARRGLSNKIKVIINGKFYQQIGTIQMDKMIVDIGKNKVDINDKVILIGEDKNKKISVEEWARLLNTISYEIICGFGKRIERIYRN
ncbi:MAG: alanine racemase [bacterium]